MGSFYSRRIGTSGPGAECAESRTASVEEEEEEKRDSAEERRLQSQIGALLTGEVEEQKRKIGSDFLFFYFMFFRIKICICTIFKHLLLCLQVNIDFNFIYSVYYRRSTVYRLAVGALQGKSLTNSRKEQNLS